MVKFLLTAGFFFLGILTSYSVGNYPAGARARGLSNAVVSLSDSWAAFHNQAGMAGLDKTFAGFYYESRFQVEELTLVAGTAVVPTRTGNFGLAFSQFGKGAFSENKFGLSFAKRLSGKFSAAIQLDYLTHRYPENDRSKGVMTFECGIIYSPAEGLCLGAHVFNPVNARMETVAGKIEVPPVFRAGGHYCFGQSVLISFETETDNRNPAVVKSGLEFSPVKNLALRVGVSGKPFQYTSGVGYSAGKFSADIGFGYHGNLGLTPAVSIQFVL